MHPYDRHTGRYGRELAAGLIELSGISRGQRVLDVGCGTGQLTMALVGVVGDENVSAVDLSEEFVAVCQSRVPAADVRVASADTLPFISDAFDAVLAQLVVNLVEDPGAAVREMARVARPGGVVAASFWDDDEMPLLRSFWDATRAAAPDALAGVNEQAQVGISDGEVLLGWWQESGLRDVVLGELQVGTQYENFDDLWSSFAAGVGYSGRTYLSLEAEQQAAVREDVRRRLGSPEGTFRLTAKALTIRGRR